MMTALPTDRDRILVIGAGASGMSAARFAVARGAQVRVVDSRSQPPNAQLIIDLGVAYTFGDLDAALVDGVDRVLLSPGISVDAELPRAAVERGLAVESDLAWFAAAANAPILAVTGSNGKSTVVAWTRDVLGHAGTKAVACGNFGPPALDCLGDDVEAYVLEVSSFQLETAPVLNARVASVLNISADHIDRHETLARYAATKARIFAGADWALVNADDAGAQAIAPKASQHVSFGSGPSVSYRLVERDNQAILARPDGSRTIPADHLAVPGRHNRLNALAVWGLAAAFGLSDETIAAGLPTFHGLPHRCQIVTQHNGVTWVNDSKGTNLGAAVASLESLAQPIIWLVGGQSKGADFASIGYLVRRTARLAVIYGVDGPSIAAALADTVPVATCDTLEQAVTIAADCAESGDTVLLSPGCASFDQFAGYAERGQAFAAAVRGVLA